MNYELLQIIKTKKGESFLFVRQNSEVNIGFWIQDDGSFLIDNSMTEGPMESSVSADLAHIVELNAEEFPEEAVGVFLNSVGQASFKMHLPAKVSRELATLCWI